MRILITGGSGFIGSTLVRLFIENGSYNVLNLDKLTYAGSAGNLDSFAQHNRYQFVQGDICNINILRKVFSEFQPDQVYHLAAESHVDRSIDNPINFINTNILGSYHLLETSLDYYNKLSDNKAKKFRFIHISTDEVFGSLSLTNNSFNRSTSYNPRSPYAASKAASDHIVRAWFHTYGLPIIVTNCSNNYGPFQFPEKFIPLMIINCLQEKPLPIYGNGSNIRDWLHVNDHCRALQMIGSNGIIGQTYMLGGNSERTNVEIVTHLCEILDRNYPRSSNKKYSELIIDDYQLDNTNKDHALGFKLGLHNLNYT